MLSIEAMLSGIIAELEVYLAIKRDQANVAWDRLVAAQGAIRTSMQAHPSRDHLQPFVERLGRLEALFPFGPVHFLSPGLIVGRSECTICGQEYGECDHVVGRPYMGQICCRRLMNTTAVEVSIVATPANKRARILALTDDNGIKRDFLSWRPLERDGEAAQTRAPVPDAHEGIG